MQLNDRDERIGDRVWLFGRSPALLADPIMQVIAFIAVLSAVFAAILFPVALTACGAQRCDVASGLLAGCQCKSL